jgi:FkbM family methyltransferase
MKLILYNFFKRTAKGIANLFGLKLVRNDIKNSEELLIKKILDQRNTTVVLDVGANEGQYAEQLIDLGFKGKIFSFEPIRSVFDKLNAKAKQISQWEAINLGIGEKETELMINVTENLVSSSLYNVATSSLEAEPKTKITHQEKITLTTVDAFLSAKNFQNEKIWLKLDIQGFELEALKGAVKSLKNIDVLQIELSFAPVYEGAPLYQDIISVMNEHKFELFTIIPVFINYSTGRMLQADGIFVRDSA